VLCSRYWKKPSVESDHCRRKISDCCILSDKPGLCTVEELAEHQRFQELPAFFKRYCPIAKQKLAVMIERGLSNAKSSADFFLRVSCMM
jgi:hypothetical protein